MKVIVAGSRDYTNSEFVYDVLDKFPWNIIDTAHEVVCGEARGPDTIGRQWAQEVGMKVASFPADWNTHGKAAGIIRNKQMAEHADAAVIFWDGKSRGTKNMIQLALQHGLILHLYRV